ncbi:hypothetical protein HDV05_008404 [Chytridiales sp. JEL 0842]|nr:hypothetical protein HDV05_008404 [Chytridiales sp. JEL 0842]
MTLETCSSPIASKAAVLQRLNVKLRQQSKDYPNTHQSAVETVTIEPQQQQQQQTVSQNAPELTQPDTQPSAVKHDRQDINIKRHSSSPVEITIDTIGIIDITAITISIDTGIAATHHLVLSAPKLAEREGSNIKSNNLLSQAIDIVEKMDSRRFERPSRLSDLAVAYRSRPDNSKALNTLEMDYQKYGGFGRSPQIPEIPRGSNFRQQYREDASMYRNEYQAEPKRMYSMEDRGNLQDRFNRLKDQRLSSTGYSAPLSFASGPFRNEAKLAPAPRALYPNGGYGSGPYSNPNSASYRMEPPGYDPRNRSIAYPAGGLPTYHERDIRGDAYRGRSSDNYFQSPPRSDQNYTFTNNQSLRPSNEYIPHNGRGAPQYDNSTFANRTAVTTPDYTKSTRAEPKKYDTTPQGFSSSLEHKIAERTITKAEHGHNESTHYAQRSPRKAQVTVSLELPKEMVVRQQNSLSSTQEANDFNASQRRLPQSMQLGEIPKGQNDSYPTGRSSNTTSIQREFPANKAESILPASRTSNTNREFNRPLQANSNVGKEDLAQKHLNDYPHQASQHSLKAVDKSASLTLLKRNSFTGLSKENVSSPTENTPARSSKSSQNGKESVPKSSNDLRSSKSNIRPLPPIDLSNPVEQPIKVGGSSYKLEAPSVEQIDLIPCSQCGRKFAKDRLQKHEDICGNTRNRKTFDPKKMRWKGTEVEGYLFEANGKVKKGDATTEKKLEELRQASKEKWKKRHEELIESLRAAKEVQQHLAKGGKISDLPPPPPTKTEPIGAPCPHCFRRFNESSLERHAAICQKLKEKGRPTKINPRIAK